MPTQAEVPGIISRVRRLLVEAATEGVHLRMVDHKLDDGWLHVVVVPSQPGTRALVHADWLSKIEQALRKRGKARVLVVPMLEE